MKKMLNNPGQFFTPEDAVALAEEMNETDDWTYVPNNPNGDLGPYSKIEIYDEDGEFVAYL